jgi:hypothetical protein
MHAATNETLSHTGTHSQSLSQHGVVFSLYFIFSRIFVLCFSLSPGPDSFPSSGKGNYVVNAEIPDEMTRPRLGCCWWKGSIVSNTTVVFDDGFI